MVTIFKMSRRAGDEKDGLSGSAAERKEGGMRPKRSRSLNGAHTRP
jgi:hypothetical protein